MAPIVPTAKKTCARGETSSAIARKSQSADEISSYTTARSMPENAEIRPKVTSAINPT